MLSIYGPDKMAVQKSCTEKESFEINSECDIKKSIIRTSLQWIIILISPRNSNEGTYNCHSDAKFMDLFNTSNQTGLEAIFKRLKTSTNITPFIKLLI